jgi:hypothetical protein
MKDGNTSSSGVKSFTMLNNLLISSGLLPLIKFDTHLQPRFLWQEFKSKTEGKGTMLQEWLDVKIVGCEDNLKEHLLINGHEFLVPLADICGVSLLRVRPR